MTLRSWPAIFGYCAVLALALLATGFACGRESGDFCSGSDDCKRGLVCHSGKCMTPRAAAVYDQEQAQALAQVQRIEELRAAKQERRLAAASGVDPVVMAERPASDTDPLLDGPAPAGTVRVSHTQGQSPIWAACRADERLIGGGCQPGFDITVRASYPSNFDARDTVGARWNCEGASRYAEKKIEAYALCLRLRDASPRAAADGGITPNP